MSSRKRWGLILSLFLILGTLFYFVVLQRNYVILLPKAGEVGAVQLELFRDFETDPAGSREVFLRIATIAEYPDSGYILRADIDDHWGSIDVDLKDVRKPPDLSFLGFMSFMDISPASVIIPLGQSADTKRLSLHNNGNTDIYSITLTDEEVIMKAENELKFSSFTESSLDRFMDNEFDISCQRYYVQDNDQHCDSFFQAIESLGAVLQSDETTSTKMQYYTRTYTYNGDLADFNPIMDTYRDDDYTLNIISTMGSLVYESYRCGGGRISRVTPEQLSIVDQRLVAFPLPEYGLTLHLPATWHVLSRENEDIKIDTTVCSSITLVVDNKTSIDNNQLGFITAPVELTNGTWWEKITPEKIVTALFTERNGKTYTIPIPWGARKLIGDPLFNASIKESIKEIAAQIEFTDSAESE